LEPPGLRLAEVPPDGLDRVAERRVVRVHQGSRHEGGHPRRIRRERLLQGAHNDRADRALGLRDAPIEWDGRHHLGGQLVLQQQIADLWTVAVSEHDLVSGFDQASDVDHCRADRPSLVGRGRAPVGSGHGVAAQRNQYASTHTGNLSRHRTPHHGRLSPTPARFIGKVPQKRDGVP